jgi:hypothetical protein
MEMRAVSVGVFEFFWKKVKTWRCQPWAILGDGSSGGDKMTELLTSFITLSNLRYIG